MACEMMTGFNFRLVMSPVLPGKHVHFSLVHAQLAYVCLQRDAPYISRQPRAHSSKPTNLPILRYLKSMVHLLSSAG